MTTTNTSREEGKGNNSAFINNNKNTENIAVDALITRLPPYFPTSRKECTIPTEIFFNCFEQHAVMETPTDTVSAKRALLRCQSELRGYMSCMEKHIASENRKPWWKVW